jgi:predicted enzyme related to lactoylglutathione lyase
MRHETHKPQVGSVLFTINLQRLAHFYEKIVGMNIVKSDSHHVVLEVGTFHLTVHQIPEQYAKNIVITVPPAVRESGAIKLSFRVDSISRSRQMAPELGGHVYGPEREWDNEETTSCDGYDSDGNVFQLFQVT